MAETPIDPDVDLRVPADRRELVGHRVAVLVAVAAGGGLGALGRHGLTTLLPARPGGFPWSTFGVNVLGCLLIGVLMVLVSEADRGHRLVRPFLGTGVLGGFTTFSTYALDVDGLLRSGAYVAAFGYLAGTLLAALLAVLAAVWLTRTGLGRRR